MLKYLILILLISCILGKFHHSSCYVKSSSVEEKIITPLTQLPPSALPTTFDWGNVNNTNFLTVTKNQHIPHYCGSCWAFAATSALSDRIKILRKAQFPDINIAPQVLVSCQQESHGCNGGDPLVSYEWIARNNITDETCSIYRA